MEALHTKPIPRLKDSKPDYIKSQFMNMIAARGDGDRMLSAVVASDSCAQFVEEVCVANGLLEDDVNRPRSHDAGLLALTQELLWSRTSQSEEKVVGQVDAIALTLLRGSVSQSTKADIIVGKNDEPIGNADGVTLRQVMQRDIMVLNVSDAEFRSTMYDRPGATTNCVFEPYEMLARVNQREVILVVNMVTENRFYGVATCDLYESARLHTSHPLSYQPLSLTDHPLSLHFEGSPCPFRNRVRQGMSTLSLGAVSGCACFGTHKIVVDIIPNPDRAIADSDPS
jgi:hypothetical protein